jgi:hypothetical protein
VSSDRAIEAWLGEQGYSLPATRERARAELEAAQLTRPGKLRISEEKLPRALAVLEARFYRWCGNGGCEASARASGREVVRCDPRGRCEHCGGSDNRRAEVELLEVCRQRNIHKLCVVGGSPAVREELDAALGRKLELRMVDGTERRTQDRARHDLEWADLVLVWGSSELHHKVSGLYTHAPPLLKRKVVHVARRGVAALLGEALDHLRRS